MGFNLGYICSHGVHGLRPVSSHHRRERAGSLEMLILGNKAGFLGTDMEVLQKCPGKG